MAAFTLDKQQLVPMAALLTLVSVILLTLLSLLLQQPTIETDLLQRTRQALAEEGLPADIIHFNGRDGVLTGTVASEVEAERLQMVVDSVYGVRDVENRLIPVSSAAAAQQAVPEPPPAPSSGLYTPSKKYPIEQLDLGAIHFDYARAELDANAIAVLDAVVAELRKTPDKAIEVSAHTDNEGTALGNMAVSQARAEVIRNYLLSQGIEAKQVKAKGYGSVRPLADNATDDGREQNRRIEISVLGG